MQAITFLVFSETRARRELETMYEDLRQKVKSDRAQKKQEIESLKNQLENNFQKCPET